MLFIAIISIIKSQIEFLIRKYNFMKYYDGFFSLWKFFFYYTYYFKSFLIQFF